MHSLTLAPDASDGRMYFFSALEFSTRQLPQCAISQALRKSSRRHNGGTTVLQGVSRHVLLAYSPTAGYTSSAPWVLLPSAIVSIRQRENSQTSESLTFHRTLGWWCSACIVSCHVGISQLLPARHQKTRHRAHYLRRRYKRRM